MFWTALTDGAPDTKMEDAFSGNGGVMEATRKGMGRDRRIGKTTGKVKGISSKDLKGKRSAVAGGKKGKETKIRGKIKVKIQVLRSEPVYCLPARFRVLSVDEPVPCVVVMKSSSRRILI